MEAMVRRRLHMGCGEPLRGNLPSLRLGGLRPAGPVTGKRLPAAPGGVRRNR